MHVVFALKLRALIANATLLIAASAVGSAQRAHRLAPTGCSPDEIFVPGSPWQIEKADLDGDGALDLVTAEEYSDCVTVLRNQLLTHCTFGSRSYGLGEDADVTHVAIGDLDGDGNPDLVPVDVIYPAGPSRVGVLRNTGNGQFGSATLYTLSAGFYGVTTADLDVDGDLDVAVSPYADGHALSVLTNLGDGALAAPVHHLLPGYAGIVCTSADLDADGRADLVTYQPRSRVNVFWNPGNGAFQSPDSYTVSEADYGYDVEQADLDGDGDLDLATCGASVLRNQGNGAFSVTSYFLGVTYEQDVSITDLDEDRDLDLVLAVGQPYGLAVFPNLGNGTFAPRYMVNVGRLLALTTADFDQDGDADVAGGNEDLPGSVRWSWNRGDGTFH